MMSRRGVWVGAFLFSQVICFFLLHLDILFGFLLKVDGGCGWAGWEYMDWRYSFLSICFALWMPEM